MKEIFKVVGTIVITVLLVFMGIFISAATIGAFTDSRMDAVSQMIMADSNSKFEEVSIRLDTVRKQLDELKVQISILQDITEKNKAAVSEIERNIRGKR